MEQCGKLFSLRFVAFGLVVILLLLRASHATAQVSKASAEAGQATDTSYLKEMPDPARVLADIHGSSSLDTAARQRVALEILSDVVESFARHEGFNLRLTPEERELNGRYRRASGDIISATYRTLDPNDQQQGVPNSPRMKWNQLRDQYWRNETFIRELLHRYLSPRNRDRYLEIRRGRMASHGTTQAEQSLPSVLAGRGRSGSPGHTGTSFLSGQRHFTRRQEQLLSSRQAPGPWKQPFLQGFVLISVGLLILTLILMTRNTRSQTIPKFTPRQHLNSQETVLFDTRPHFIAIVGLSRVIWFFIGSLLVPLIAAGIAAGAGGAPFWYVLFSWFLLVLLPLLIRVLRWRNVFYSLTDQRIMHGHGVINKSFNAQQLARIGGLLDVSTYRITGVTFGQKLSGRMFNFGNIIFQTNHRDIRWLGIKDPLNVRRLIEEKVATFQDLGANQATYNEAIIKKVAEVRTEESFGLVSPKHDVSIQDKVGGASLLQTPSAFRYCSNCGRQNPAEAAYCSQCGKQAGGPL